MWSLRKTLIQLAVQYCEIFPLHSLFLPFWAQSLAIQSRLIKFQVYSYHMQTVLVYNIYEYRDNIILCLHVHVVSPRTLVL